LQAIISGLESQLSAQKAALARAPAAQAVEPEPAAQTSPKPKPAAEPKASPLHDAATSTAGNSGWFVNFSSYSQRDTAESWSGRLKPGQGQVVVEAAQSNGKRIYRVRVVNLPDKETAQALAVQLQQKFNTGKLWVGRSS
jgi:cell division septation protein DedD